MTLTEYVKPALAVVFFAALGGVWYWFEHRSHPEVKETPGTALVVVTKSTNACFSDMVRGTGYVVPRREAVVGVDQEGSKVTDVFVKANSPPAYLDQPEFQTFVDADAKRLIPVIKKIGRLDEKEK